MKVSLDMMDKTSVTIQKRDKNISNGVIKFTGSGFGHIVNMELLFRFWYYCTVLFIIFLLHIT